MEYKISEKKEVNEVLVEKIRQEYLEGKKSVLFYVKITARENFVKSNRIDTVEMSEKFADFYTSSIEKTMDGIVNSEFKLDQKEKGHRIAIRKYNLIKQHGYKNITDFVYDTFIGICLHHDSQISEVPEWYKKWDDLSLKLAGIEIEEVIREVALESIEKDKQDKQ